MPNKFDIDLESIQEARDLAIASREAQRAFVTATQAEVDRICEAMAEAAYAESEMLARMANEETGFGVIKHKIIKNQFASRGVWKSIRDIPTVGVLRRDEAKRIIEIAWPFGVVAALIPSTNPTSTVICKGLGAIKARNGIVFSPHPAARQSSYQAAQIMIEAGEKAGMPKGLIGCLTKLTLPGTQELMSHWATSLILATGGPGMVKAAHGVGKPAIGVGPGNVPVYVDRSADIEHAARCIVNSKAFDCSVICSTEQSIVADKLIAGQLREALRSNGAYFLDADQKVAIARTLFFSDGSINARSVGKTPQMLARMAGIEIPKWARVLIADLETVGKEEPISREKLTTVLGFYVEDGWHAGCERCIQLLRFGGDGHSLSIHCRDEEIILAFGLEKPAFRIVVNTWSSLGAVGATTALMPSLTLAPGGLGGTVVSDNITVTHLFNIKRLAYGITEPPPEAFTLAPDVVPELEPLAARANGHANGNGKTDLELVETVVRKVIAEWSKTTEAR
jgi:acetaldehyde dehydrogenase (acetylating)